MANKRKKKPKENKQAKREVGGESTQVSLFWLVLWINYKNWKVTTKTAMNLIPFRTFLLRTFSGDEDIVSPASLLCHCGWISLKVQMIQDLSTIKTLCNTLPHQTNAPSKLNKNTSTKKWKQNRLSVFSFSCHFFWSKGPKMYWPAQKRNLGK